MNVFDPHGAIRESRRQRDRRECYVSILFGIGVGCALVIGVCIFMVTMSLRGR